MNKNLSLLLATVLLISGVYGQTSETVDNAKPSAAFTEKNQLRVFKEKNVTEDKTDMLTITGASGASFSTSNTSDGSYSSYTHSQRVSLTLTVTGGKAATAQLVFYSPSEKMPYAAVSSEEGIIAYYPISFFDEIKGRLDQALSTKKKVQLKITQKTNGYREAVIVF